MDPCMSVCSLHPGSANGITRSFSCWRMVSALQRLPTYLSTRWTLGRDSDPALGAGEDDPVIYQADDGDL
jgi:hypothetical protein